MALIKCPECGSMISDKASACPKCGLPMRHQVTTTETDGNIAMVESSGYNMAQEDNYIGDDNDRKNRKSLYVKIAAFLIAILALVAYAWKEGYLSLNRVSSSDVNGFMASFALAVNNGDTTAVQTMYPDVVKADSLSSLSDISSLVLESNEKGDTTLVKMDSGITLILAGTSKDSLQVVSSKGLFAYPVADIELARNTGQWDESLTDVELAERMADKSFKEYLENKFYSYVINNLKVVGVEEVEGAQGDAHFDYWHSHFSIIIVNNTNIVFSGSDYSLYLSIYVYDGRIGDIFYGKRRKDKEYSHSITGVNIGAGRKASVVTYGPSPDEDYLWGCKEEAILTLKLTKPQLFKKYFKATGKEYRDYISTKQ